MEEITIIFVKANYCSHCNRFQEVFDKTVDVLNNRFKEKSIDTTTKVKKMSDFMEILKTLKYKELVEYKIKFEIYDFDKNKDNDYKTEDDFNKLYYQIANKVEGFPTIFIKMLDANKNINFSIIEHTYKNPELEENKQLQDAIDRFISNIINEIKTVKSDSHIKVVNVGGKILKHKYEKYKHKLSQINKQKGGKITSEHNNDYLTGYIKFKEEYLKSKK